MPIPSGYSRNTISGHLRNGEEFAWSFWCDEAPSDQGATQTQADFIATDFNNLATTSGNPMGFIDSDSGYDKLTVYSYLDTSGKATHVAEADLGHVGTSSSGSLPNQCSLVCSLRTATAGRRGRGRVYLPCNDTVMSSGQVASGNVGQLATWMAAFLTSVNGDLGDQHVVVLSQVSGTAHPITSVVVDSKIDIQRRRAKSEVALHSDTEAVTHP